MSRLRSGYRASACCSGFSALSRVLAPVLASLYALPKDRACAAVRHPARRRQCLEVALVA